MVAKAMPCNFSTGPSATAASYSTKNIEGGFEKVITIGGDDSNNGAKKQEPVKRRNAAQIRAPDTTGLREPLGWFSSWSLPGNMSTMTSCLVSIY